MVGLVGFIALPVSVTFSTPDERVKGQLERTLPARGNRPGGAVHEAEGGKPATKSS